jgi:glutaredoxin
LKRLRFIVLGMVVAVILLLGLPLLHRDAVSAAPQTQTEKPLYIYFFWGEGCPHCAEAEPFLENMSRIYKNVEVESFEVWYDARNRALFQQMAEAHDIESRYVPTIFIGDKIWIGFNAAIGDEIETAIAICSTSSCPDAGENIFPGHESSPESTPQPPPTEQDGRSNPGQSVKILSVPLLGEVNLNAQSLWVSTTLISFVDGFNPCSLWVLSILIALTLRTGSRKKIFIIGLTFITVTALVYVLFIAGLFTMLTFIQFLGWIQIVVSLLALFFAAINIKDYFWYKEGLSFTIDDAQKPGLYKRMRRVLQAGDSLFALVTATVGLGVGVSLVEFSCTAGFPVLWTNIIAAQNVTPFTFALLLFLYMFIYQIDELGIFLIAVITLRASRLEEKHGRILKLIGGTLMLTLAIVMLVNPALMNDVLSSVIIFSIAFGVALLVLFIHRVVLPRFGIFIGTEEGIHPDK